MEIRACEWCGKEFEAKTRRSRHCSISCRGKHYYHTHPEYRRKQIGNSQRRLAADPEARAIVLAAGARWRENNREAAREATRRWYQNNREHCATKNKEWRAANHEKQLEYSRRWRKENPLRSRLFDMAKHAKRKAEKLGGGGSYTVQEFLNLCESCGWQCSYCSCALTVETATADHMIPLSRGGSSDISNITPSCRSCNSSKHDKTPEEYMFWREPIEVVVPN